MFSKLSNRKYNYGSLPVTKAVNITTIPQCSLFTNHHFFNLQEISFKG